jgi:putative SOS response-associated peptidase YedK
LERRIDSAAAEAKHSGMCGRATNLLTWREIVSLYRLTDDWRPNIEPSYNLAPTADIWVCGGVSRARRVEAMRWGLVPHWAKELPKYATFNARSDGLDKPTWRGSLEDKRGVVALSGFFEWRKDGAEKQPYYITRRDGAPIIIAALWAANDRFADIRPKSAAIITCEPNEAMAAIHNRMPVILAPDAIDAWLSGGWEEDKRAMLKSCPSEWLTASPVGKAVGNVRNKGAELIEPIGDKLF